MDNLAEHQERLVLYTVGAKGERETGNAVWQHILAEDILRNVCSIYTAELNAIKAAVEMAKDAEVDTVAICTDAKSCTQGIVRYDRKHPIIIKIINYAGSLATSG